MQVIYASMLGIDKLSASVTHNVSGFIMTSFRRHDEADSVGYRRQSKCASKKLIQAGQSGD